MQKAIDDRNLEMISAEKVRVPLTSVSLNEEQTEAIEKMIEKFEDDDDVLQVFTNVA